MVASPALVDQSIWRRAHFWLTNQSLSVAALVRPHPGSVNRRSNGAGKRQQVMSPWTSFALIHLNDSLIRRYRSASRTSSPWPPSLPSCLMLRDAILHIDRLSTNPGQSPPWYNGVPVQSISARGTLIRSYTERPSVYWETSAGDCITGRPSVCWKK